MIVLLWILGGIATLGWIEATSDDKPSFVEAVAIVLAWPGIVALGFLVGASTRLWSATIRRDGRA